MEREQKQDRVTKLVRKQQLVKKEIVELEAEEDARAKLAAAKANNLNNSLNAQPAAEGKPVSRGADPVRVVSMPTSLVPNPFARGVSSVAETNGKSSFASFGSVGGGPPGGAYSNERGGYSNERGGEGAEEEDVEMS